MTAPRRPTHEHRPDLAGFRFGVCRKGHTAMSQRTCLDCKKNYCLECAGQTLAGVIAKRKAGEGA
jgi:hypothetical protein